MSLPIGGRVGPYAIEATIGHGGMGDVYQARDERLGRRVALKVLLPKLVHDSSFRDRFIRESHLLAAIEHPRIVPIYDAGEVQGVLYIAMRFVEGPDLGSVIASSGPLDPARSASIVEQIADALDAAHAVGLVHRDVKPANILGAADRDVYLSDFGLTKRKSSESGLTQIGMFVGTPGYVAPEQIEGRPLDGRTDQYALACVLHACLTGDEPYRRESDVAVLWAHLTEKPPTVSHRRPDLPAGIDEVLARGLAKLQTDRYESCGDFAAAAAAALGLDQGAWRHSFRRVKATPDVDAAVVASTPANVAEPSWPIDQPLGLGAPAQPIEEVPKATRPIEELTRPIEDLPQPARPIEEPTVPLDRPIVAAATQLDSVAGAIPEIAPGPTAPPAVAAAPLAAASTVLDVDARPTRHRRPREAAAPTLVDAVIEGDVGSELPARETGRGAISPTAIDEPLIAGEPQLLRVGPVHVIVLLAAAVALGLVASILIAGSLAPP